MDRTDRRSRGGWEPGLLLAIARAGRTAILVLVLAGTLLAGCQASQPSAPPPAATAATERPGTPAELTRLKDAVKWWRLANGVRALGLRSELEAALHAWTFRRDLNRAIANYHARQEYIALIRRVSGQIGGSTIPVGSPPGGVAVASLASWTAPVVGGWPGSLRAPTAPANQCAIDLGGQGNPPPVSQATLRWLGGQDPSDEEPPPVSQETLDWIAAQEAAEANPPPVSQETLDWIAQQEAAEANPPPVSQETLDWIAEHDATDANPPPVSQETLDWIAEQEAAEANPPPVSQETLDWIAEQEAAGANPPPVSQETLDWIAEQEASEPPPVSQETLDWIAEQEASEANPPPVSQETLDWIAEQEAAEANPPPVSQETLDWIAKQEADEANPPPISDELQQWLDEQDGAAPAAPPPPAPPCGWSIDQASGGGRIKGKHCGDAPGKWIVDGTYDVGGLKGTQKWAITIRANGSTGSFTYSVSSKGKPFGAPLTVYLTGEAGGTVTLAIDPADGVAHMVLTETHHTYATTTDKGGSGNDQNAPLETSRLDWPPDPAC